MTHFAAAVMDLRANSRSLDEGIATARARLALWGKRLERQRAELCRLRRWHLRPFGRICSLAADAALWPLAICLRVKRYRGRQRG